MSISNISASRYTNQNPMEFELDVIRSERRRNSLSLYNLKQYRAIYHQSKEICEDSGHSERNSEKIDRQMQQSSSKRKILSQILPSRLIIDKKDDESRIDNISTTMANQRRSSDTFSPYGTRSFPSLRQRPPSTDSNLSMSTNSLDLSSHKTGFNIPNGINEFNNSSSTSSDARRISTNSLKQMPVSHHRISLTAPRQPPYLYQSQSKSKLL